MRVDHEEQPMAERDLLDDLGAARCVSAGVGRAPAANAKNAGGVATSASIQIANCIGSRLAREQRRVEQLPDRVARQQAELVPVARTGPGSACAIRRRGSHAHQRSAAAVIAGAVMSATSASSRPISSTF